MDQEKRYDPVDYRLLSIPQLRCPTICKMRKILMKPVEKPIVFPLVLRYNERDRTVTAEAVSESVILKKEIYHATQSPCVSFDRN